MNEPKFTPGNWSVENRMTCGEGWAVVSDHDFPTKAGKSYRVYVSQISNIEDAHLLSASKELLSTLKRIMQDVDHMIESGIIPEVRDDIIYQNAKKAIEKAEGGKTNET